ncbi:MAG: ATP-binding protein [Acidobacteriota bacterium]
MVYIERTLEDVIKRAARQFPVVVLTGPRQSGKTTLLKHVFGGTHRYVSLDPPDVRLAATEDPRGFLASQRPPVIFDEAQSAPVLLPYIKEEVDRHRDRAGQFLLTGSQNLMLAQGVTESLAGRAALLRLLPLARREIAGQPQLALPWETQKGRPAPRPLDLPIWPSLLRGGYPELISGRITDTALWHASYVQTYLERDVRSLRQIGDLGQFQAFLRLVASRTAQLLNLSDAARDLGVAVNTVKAWLSILEATYQVIVLRPYWANVGKRLVKSPKVYFTDTGTLSYLAGLQDPSHAANGPLGGPLLETAVITEVLRSLAHRGIEPQLYFWRTATGVEVDLVVDTGPTLVPIEVKLSSTPNPAMARGIEAFRRDIGPRAIRGFVVHPGNITLPLGPDAVALPLSAL